MGRRPLPDHVKIARGTFEPRQSEAARAARTASNIALFPTLSEIPEPEIPMGPVGRKAYDTWARRLLETGRLTMVSVGYVQQYALALDSMDKLQAMGKPISANYMTVANRALDQIKALDVDLPIGKQAQSQGKFARSGFSAGIRRPPAGGDR